MEEDLKLPEFLNSQEKYNKLICETNTLKKFEDIYIKLLSDEELEMSSILELMKIIERDVILVNQLTEATGVVEMTETFLRYMMMKKSETKKKEVKNPKPPKKIAKDKMNNYKNFQNKILKNTTTTTTKVFLKKEPGNVTANKIKKLNLYIPSWIMMLMFPFQDLEVKWTIVYSVCLCLWLDETIVNPPIGSCHLILWWTLWLVIGTCYMT